MNTHELFSLLRLRMLLSKYLLENHRRLLLQGLMLTALMIIVATLCGLMSDWDSYLMSGTSSSIKPELRWFTAITFLMGLVVASSAFSTMSTTRESLHTLTCPASWLEAFTVRWIVAVPLFILWALASALVADSVRVLITWLTLPSASPFAPIIPLIFGRSSIFGADPGDFWELLLFMLSLQSFFLLGAIVWRTHHFIKTFISLWAIGLAYCITGFGVVLSTYGPCFWLKQPTIDVDTLVNIVLTVIILINYSLTCLRFKEADLINRW
ncbi:MAG: hypothetical protein NC039_04360 [Muribaculaceae bacterium]|nr:hypothetical protein [Muribaculaceae bacterium]